MLVNLDELFNGKTDEEILKEIRKHKLAERVKKIEKEKKDDDIAVVLGQDLMDRFEKAVEAAKAEEEEIDRKNRRDQAALDNDDDEEDKDDDDVESEEPTEIDNDWYSGGVDSGT